MMRLEVGQRALLVFLFSMPWVLYPAHHRSPHDVARIIVMAITLLAAWSLPRVVLTPRRLLRLSVVPMALAALVSLALLSAAVAPVREVAFRELAQLVGLVCVSAMVAMQTGHQREERLLLLACVWGSAAYSALVLTLVLSGTAAQAAGLREDVFVGYANYRFFNHVQSIALPVLAIAATHAAAGGALRRWAWFSLVSGFAFLFFLGGRATLSGLAVGWLICAVCARGSAARLLRNLLLAAIAGLALYLLLFVIGPLVLGMPADRMDASRTGSVHARFELWRLAWGYIVSSPWLGIGPMHYAHYVNPEAAHPHNAYLQVAAEWGVPVAVLAIVLALTGLHRFMSRLRSTTDERQAVVGAGLLLALTSALVDAFFSGNLVMPVSQLWFAMVVGWAFAWYARQAPASDGTGSTAAGERSLIQWILPLLLVSSQLWLWWSIWPEWTDLPAHLDRVKAELANNERLNPRFWSHGWF
ncbi:O-antigen ligase family protein [Aquabacterium sp. J223]|uniref:O-antigen ligase family protein n=1 Tax=Aquabacterium sp. J223 TaxID=2898431 RepID=UPI0021ADAB6C|nr:O-antigen ligase family protein [Aquabacterium sp. J223]UUX97772.1 O-antigen ligase family protein [Aquabacterium sp. J223]